MSPTTLASLANAPLLAVARTGAVVGATRPIAGRLAALGKTGSLRSHPLADDRLKWGALRHPARQPRDGSAATRSFAGEARAPGDRPHGRDDRAEASASEPGAASAA